MVCDAPVHDLAKISDTAILISSVSHPKTLKDLDLLHKDPMYELVTGAREALLMKKLAHKLGTDVSKSKDVQNLSALISDSSREVERTWRMAACMANTPVSTSYPFLPTMPSVAAVVKAAPVPPGEGAPTSMASMPIFGSILLPCINSNSAFTNYNSFI